MYRCLWVASSNKIHATEDGERVVCTMATTTRRNNLGVAEFDLEDTTACKRCVAIVRKRK